MQERGSRWRACGHRRAGDFAQLPRFALVRNVFDRADAGSYVLSLLFSLVYGYFAARNRSAERVLMPTLDVLQSVPILSFLPIVILSLTAVLPQSLAAELAAIVLIFTSQAWNMTFSFYQSMTMIPTEQREAAAIFRLNPWLRFKTMELPFATLGAGLEQHHELVGRLVLSDGG